MKSEGCSGLAYQLSAIYHAHSAIRRQLFATVGRVATLYWIQSYRMFRGLNAVHGVAMQNTFVFGSKVKPEVLCHETDVFVILNLKSPDPLWRRAKYYITGSRLH